MSAAGGRPSGIVSWGAYLPYWRLERALIAEALGLPSARGSRSVAGYDEDTTTLAVEAARVVLSDPGSATPGTVLFSTPEPAYLDKASAATIHAALGLPKEVGAYDLCGGVRSAFGALRAALALGHDAPSLLTVAEVRTGLAGGAEERESGDGAAALVCGNDSVVAEVLAQRCSTEEFLDRWRVPGAGVSHQWEERFGEEVYVPLATSAFDEALKEAGVGAGQVDHLVVAGLHARAARATRARLGVPPQADGRDFSSVVGNLGAAHPLVALADVLDTARPGQLIVVVVLADGVDVVVLRTTPTLAEAQGERAAANVPTVSDQLASARGALSYTRFLTWRGQLRREPPRRPDPERPGAPTMWRSEAWKFGFVASRCAKCGFRHLPPTRVCLECHAVDQMEPERLADVPGSVATYTVDRLAASPSPPVVGVVVDFQGGGRYRCEMTDLDVSELAIGAPVQMTFRRVYTADDVHNYFWKAQPRRTTRAGPGAGPTEEG